jgi:membrane protease YdiL (CAAX protease family)
VSSLSGLRGNYGSQSITTRSGRQFFSNPTQKKEGKKMKTTIEWLKRLWKLISRIEIEVALAIATIGLLPICLSASEHWAGYYISMAVISLIVVAGIVWRKVRKKQKIKEKFPHDGLEGFAVVLNWIKTAILLLIAGTAFVLWVFRKELWLAIQNNPIPSVFLFLVAIVIVWRIKVENKKDRRILQRADEVLELYKSEHLRE